MGSRFRGGDLPGQAYLLPPDVRDWLPGRHLAWAMLDLTAGMDLSAFTGWYRADGQGRPAYHPAMMVTLISYCYCKGIRSSRAVEAATYDDLGARVICGNLHPDHSTVARFAGRHEDAVKALVVSSVIACAREGLVSVDVVAGDGTKVKASASVSSNLTAGQLEAEIGELEELIAAEVDAWVAQARAEDAADAAEDAARVGEDHRGGPGGQDVLPGTGAPGTDAPGPGAGGGLPGLALAKKTDKLARRRKAKQKLEAEAAQRQRDAEAARADKITRLAAGAAARQAKADAMAGRADARFAAWQGKARRPRGPVPVPAGANAHVARARQVAARAAAALAEATEAPAAVPEPARPLRASATDPSARPMPLKNGGFGMCHNLQVLACRSQVIVALARHDSPLDLRALHPLLAAARANLDAAGIPGPIGKALFDAGYASDANFTAACEADLYVAVTKEARQTGRLADGKKFSTRKDSRAQMAARLATPAGKDLYKQRAGIIEPVFAQLFSRLGRTLNYRDDKTDLELHLWAATHNMLKAIRARQRRTTAATAAA